MTAGNIGIDAAAAAVPIVVAFGAILATWIVTRSRVATERTRELARWCDDLRERADWLEQQRDRDNGECRDRLARLEKLHAAQIGELRGELETLKSSLIADLVAEMTTHLTDAVFRAARDAFGTAPR